MHALPLLAALLALAGAPARVPTPDEQRLFDEGTRAFSSGDAAGAEKAWRAGYALGHDPAFLVRIGEAQEKAGAPAQAAASYRAYLQQAPDASDRAEIEQRPPRPRRRRPLRRRPTSAARPPRWRRRRRRRPACPHPPWLRAPTPSTRPARPRPKIRGGTVTTSRRSSPPRSRWPCSARPASSPRPPARTATTST